ncbi:MAG: glycosyltransferase [Parcubacteria group bacterium]
MEIQSSILYVSLFITLFFEVFLLITYLEAREGIEFEKNMSRKGVKNFPSVTIIVPCYNEEKTLSDTVKSLLKLDYPKDKLSILLVDDGSIDGTSRIFQKFAHHPQIDTIYKENGGKHTALNFALERVKSDLVGCLDADSFVNSDALSKIVPFFDNSEIMAVTPSIKVYEPETFLQHLQKVEYSWGIFLRRMLSSLGALYVTPGPFSIFRVTVFKELGGYRQAHNTEDLEIALRLQKNRYKIVNSSGAHVYTVTPRSLGALFRQRVRWTYGFINNSFDYREMFFNRKYGNIGFFILPVALVSIFSSIYIVGNALVNVMGRVSDTFIRFRAVGFGSGFQMPSFDWYFLNTGVLPIITITAISLSIFIIYLAVSLSDGRFKMSRGILYYLVVYGFIVPLWLIRALFDTAFRRKVTWR